jgi:hypothetical protein
MMLPRTLLTLLLAIATIVSSSRSAQANSISPEFKATLEAADLKYEIKGEDAVQVDLKFKMPGWKESYKGLIYISSPSQTGNLKSRQLRVAFYPPGQPLPNNLPMEMLLQAPSRLFCFGSAALNTTTNGAIQLIYRRDVNDDEMRRHPEELRKNLGFALKCVDELRSEIER